jgi:2-amino-4-hydroxy-6-hydroxymethyldihydropteridine diphosphokinase
VVRAFVGIGSNIDPERNIERAIGRLREHVCVRAVSTFYRSQPIGRPEQAPFLNGVVEVEAEREPRALKTEVLRRIEAELGRVRTADKYAARTVDLDLLIYGEITADEPGLQLPDPDIRSRPFLAAGICELAPDLVLPGDGRTMREIVAALADAAMEPLPHYTAKLRETLNDELRESAEPD